ncbi:hypothetical protein [Nocardia bovistercoris]|uniref:hypothetical protein n=1 Tax=Nocardia bovistercoris TaxID=2785916 RepID=UPI002FCD13EB
MASEGDAKDDEAGRRSEFGPPVGDFGPPVGDFGPPVGDFGPPVADFGGPVADFGGPMTDFGGPVADFGGPPQAEPAQGWSVPQAPANHPEVGWRPAGGTAAMVPPPQYRAPEASAAPEAPIETDAGQRPEPKTPSPDRWWSPTDTGEVPKPPELSPSESGLSWADDPIAKRLAPGAPTSEPSGSRFSVSRLALGIVGALAVVIALVVVIVAVSSGGGEDEQPTAAPPPPKTTAALSCPASRDGKVTVGNGPGDTLRGPDAVLGFQYAFYVERSGEKVRRFVAPDAENISTAEVIQRAISEQIPPGTTHCLRITELGADSFDVDLTEHRPDGTTTVYRQTVITVEREGRTLVFAIRERG